MKILIAFILLAGASQPSMQKNTYQCLPCGNSCDEKKYGAPGTCEHCQMDLVESSTITFNSIEPSEICQHIAAHPHAVLLDVRTKEEFEGKTTPSFGTLKNSINIPIQELQNRSRELDRYKDQEIIVFCSYSHRSPQASYLLSQLGFKKLTNMNGGLSVVGEVDCKK